MKIRPFYLAVLLSSPVYVVLSSPRENHKLTNLTHVISDYRASLASLPLDYFLLEKNNYSELC